MIQSTMSFWKKKKDAQREDLSIPAEPEEPAPQPPPADDLSISEPDELRPAVEPEPEEFQPPAGPEPPLAEAPVDEGDTEIIIEDCTDEGHSQAFLGELMTAFDVELEKVMLADTLTTQERANKKLRDRVQELERQIRRLNEDKAELENRKARLDEQARKFEEEKEDIRLGRELLVREGKKAQERIDALEREAAGLREKCETLERQNDDLKRAAPEAVPVEDVTFEIPHPLGDVEPVIPEDEDPSKMVRELKEDGRKKEKEAPVQTEGAVTPEMEDLRKENEELIEAAKDWQGRYEKAMMEKSAVEVRYDNLEGDLKAARKERDDLRDERMSMKEKAENSKEVASLQGKILSKVLEKDAATVIGIVKSLGVSRDDLKKLI